MNESNLIRNGLLPKKLRRLMTRISSSSINRRMARGMFWSLIGSIISRGLMLAATVFIARLLGKTAYGELGVMQSTIGMFGVFAGFGLGLTATKHVAEYRKNDPRRAGRVIALSSWFALVTGGLMSLMLFIMAPWLSRNTINAPHLSDPLRLGAIILFLSALNGAQSGALSGFEAFKTIAHINLFIGLISFPILVAGAYYGGLQGVLLAMAANLALNWIINNRALHREANRSFVPLDHFGCTQELSVLWKFSLPAALSAVLVGPTNWICAALLVNQPRGYEEMGLFNAANQWRMAILFVPGVVGQVVLPLLSSIHAESDKLQFRRVLKVNIVLGVAISLSVALPIILAANLIMSIYGPGFEMGALTLKILAFSSILTAANSVVGYAISSRGKMWVGFLFNALWAISLIVAVHIMIRGEYGATGMAYAILVSYALHTVWQIIYLAAVLKPKNSGQVLMA